MDKSREKLYPSCKFLIVILYSLCTLILSSFNFSYGKRIALLGGWFMLMILIGALSRGLTKMVKPLKTVFILALIIAVFQILFVKDGNEVFSFWIISADRIGINSAISLGFSVLNIAGIFIWLFQTTKEKEIAYALEHMGMNHKAAYIFISTLKMIDVLGKNSKTIMNSQRARGVETEGNVLVRTKAFIPSLIPLILGAITSAEEKVLTLECKGFSVETKKTHVFQVKKSGKEIYANIAAVLITLAIIVWRGYAWIG